MRAGNDLEYLLKKVNISGTKVIPINLSFFNDSAEEKTEPASARKKNKARDEGQVLQSNEVGIAVLFLTAFQGLRIFGGYIYDGVFDYMVFGINLLREPPVPEPGIINDYVVNAFGEILILSMPLLAMALVGGLIVNVMQVGWHPTTKPLRPKMSKLNPLKGIKNIISFKAIIELVKSLLKLAIIGGGIYSSLSSQLDMLQRFAYMDLKSSMLFLGNIIIDIGMMVGGLYVVIAGLDYLYQWYTHTKSLKMTKQEVKDEYKMTEGDPKVKSAIRQKMLQAGMRRMMSNVPNADVIITNPTHFAVALKYDKELGEAPVVLAKGSDYIAKRIKDKARENRIEIVENKPLARALFDTVEVGKEIPPELYQAVAEIFAYLARLNKIAV